MLFFPFACHFLYICCHTVGVYILKKRHGQHAHPYSSLISSLGLSQQVGAWHYPDSANMKPWTRRSCSERKKNQMIMYEWGVLACLVAQNNGRGPLGAWCGNSSDIMSLGCWSSDDMPWWKESDVPHNPIIRRHVSLSHVYGCGANEIGDGGEGSNQRMSEWLQLYDIQHVPVFQRQLSAVHPADDPAAQGNVFCQGCKH